MSSNEIDLAAMAEMLTGSPDYRVLRRLAPRTEFARRCRMAPGTARKAFAELVEKGFIECVQKGAFSYKSRHASEWRLTWEACDVTGGLPTKAFINWGKEKQNPVSNHSPTVSN